MDACVCVSLRNEIIHVSSNRFVFSFRLFSISSSLCFRSVLYHLWLVRLDFSAVAYHFAKCCAHRDWNRQHCQNEKRAIGCHIQIVCDFLVITIAIYDGAWWGTRVTRLNETAERRNQFRKFINFRFSLILLSLWRATALFLIDVGIAAKSFTQHFIGVRLPR